MTSKKRNFQAENLKNILSSEAFGKTIQEANQVAQRHGDARFTVYGLGETNEYVVTPIWKTSPRNHGDRNWEWTRFDFEMREFGQPPHDAYRAISTYLIPKSKMTRDVIESALTEFDSAYGTNRPILGVAAMESDRGDLVLMQKTFSSSLFDRKLDLVSQLKERIGTAGIDFANSIELPGYIRAAVVPIQSDKRLAEINPLSLGRLGRFADPRGPPMK